MKWRRRTLSHEILFTLQGTLETDSLRTQLLQARRNSRALSIAEMLLQILQRLEPPILNRKTQQHENCWSSLYLLTELNQLQVNGCGFSILLRFLRILPFRLEPLAQSLHRSH